MDAVEEIKGRVSIEDVVAEYVQLKRAGRNWRGLSPFTNEKTPSFMVSPEKQIWHDFSSGKGGNVFSFVMEVEGLDFKGALDLLARKAGVDLEQYRGSQAGSNTKLKERLYAANEMATKFYQTQFKNHRQALEYILNKRSFTKATALEWQLGYSPNTGRALAVFLKSKKFTDEEIRRAGLTTQRYRESVDMFRGRIMIPLTDPQGRVIGFTARLLNDDEPDAPKYINTSQTPLYDKSRHVFGLHLAKEAIRKSHFVVIAEGNMDVIASHQVGVRQVVATAGTALTEQQLKALSRFTNDIRLCFDADQAGVNATERAIPIAAKVGVNLSVITIPSGKDPDELIRQEPKRWQQIIEQPSYALDWLIERYRQQLDLTTALGKRQFSDVILAVVRGLNDQVEQEHYLTQISQLIGVSRSALLSKLRPTEQATPRRARQVSPVINELEQVEIIKAQNHLLGLCLFQPHLRDYLIPLTGEMLLDEPARKCLAFLKSHPEYAGNGEAKALQPISDYVKMITFAYEQLYEGLELLEMRYEAARLQARLVEHYVKIKKQQLTKTLQTADEPGTQTLLNEAKALDALLKSTLGGLDGNN